MKKQKKHLLTDEYKDILHKYPLILVIHYNNLVNNYTTFEYVKDDFLNLIKKTSETSEVFIRVVKNNLLKSALKETQYKHMIPLFCGPTLILYSTTASIELIQKTINWKSNLNYLHLVGAKFENTFLSYEDIMDMKNLASQKDIILLNTISLLEISLASSIETIISANSTLYNTLDVHSKNIN